jgi:hypothetical protein
MEALGCEHVFSFKGAVQLYRSGELAGVVDVLGCRKCGATDVIVKRTGVSPSGESGFHPSPKGHDRFVLICRSGSRVDWQVVTLQLPTMLVHDCVPAERSLSIRVSTDQTAEKVGGVEHSLVPLEPNLNRAVKLD